MTVPWDAPLRVLLVEDNDLHARLVREMLGDELHGAVDLLHAGRLAEVSPSTARTVDCILLDLSLPDAQGMEAVVALRTTAPDVPLVVLSARGDHATAVRALHHGAQDHLPKGEIDGALLARSIRYAIERKRLEAQLAHQAMHDVLTGLPNRALLLDRLQVALLRGGRRTGTVAVFFVGLDGFKGINDAFGHAAGDEILRTVAARLGGAVRPEDTVARFGSDEFVVLCADIADPGTAVGIARDLVAALSPPVRLGSRDVFTTASIGVAWSDAGEGADAESLLRDADGAMYRAKRGGKDRFELHDRSVAARREPGGEAALRRAVEDRELVLQYQPIVDLLTGETVAVEALVRWAHPVLGLRGPADFIPLAERSGLIVPLGAWVLEEAVAQVAHWRRGGHRELSVSVNLSAVQLAHPSLVDLVRSTLDRHGLPAEALWLEVTETAVMQDVQTSRATLAALDALGVQVVLDDFGTGHSSLAYLASLPASTIKLDQAFMSWFGELPEAPTLVRGVLSLLRSLGKRVIAEGVETADHLEQLCRLGCGMAQGYLLGPPARAAEVDVDLSSADGAERGQERLVALGRV